MPSDRLRLRDVRSTTTFRLTLALGIVFLAGLVAMLGLIYELTAHELTLRSDRILIERADSLLTTPAEKLPERIRTEIANAAQGFSYFALLDARGNNLVGNLTLTKPPPVGKPFNLDRGPDGRPLRVLAVETANRETILLGRDINQIRKLRRRIFQIVIGSGASVAVGMLLAAILLSVPQLRRLRDLQRASQAIADGKLETRMPISWRKDELDQIAATVNLMIEEVGHVIAQVKTTTDAVAHDLRTPLTRVRAQLHRLRRSFNLDADDQALLDQATEDLGLLLSRFTALLRISELEASSRRSGLAPVALAPFLEAVAALYEPLAEDRGISLVTECASMPFVEVDEKLMFEAVSNLVDNAIKFARTKVVLRLLEEKGRARLDVADDGPGIAVEEREAVLRRFHRSPDAASVPGSGLGLSVVAAILHLHGFTLELGDAQPGLIATIRM